MSATPVGTAYVGAMQRNVCMFILFLVAIFNAADRFVIQILIEPWKLEFGLTDSMIGLLIGPAFALFYATAGIPIARLADVSNRRNIIVAALGVWSAMTALTGYAQNVVQLFLLRIGLGIGEAGATPPSHSLISDYYPPEKRAFAFAFLNIGNSVGSIFVFVAGALILDQYGWRALLIIMGLPGILIAVISYFILVEPRKPAPMPSLVSTFAESLKAARELFAVPAYRHLAICFTIYGFISIGAFQWDVTLFGRSFGLPQKDVAIAYGAAATLSSLTGLMIGGWLGNYLSKRDISWLARFPAIAVFAAFPFMVGKYLMPDFYGAMAMMVLGSLILIMFVGPFYAAVQAVAGKNRSMAIAILIFLTNIIGYALGASVTGFLSDALRPIAGEDSLRYAVLIIVFMIPWAGFHVYRASRLMIGKTFS
jgi:MFS family permease